MKKIIILIILAVLLGSGMYYYFLPKTITSCGVTSKGTSCGVWECKRGFAMDGIAKPICFLGGEPVLK